MIKPLCSMFGPSTSAELPGTSKNYKQIKRYCKRSGQLFIDRAFPANNSSLFIDENKCTDIVWKRPGEIVKDPKLFVEGASPNDVTQGILGNCWFVSACSALTHNEALLQQVIPGAGDQEWSDENVYCGIFQFCFWYFGRWEEVLIDDYLPTKDGNLLFARSRTENEFWSALLEKAFAKVYGCYENLVGGQLSDALQDLSGGVAITLHVQKFLQNYKKSHVLSPNGDLATKNNNVNKPLPPLPSLPSAEETTTPGSTKLFQTLRHAFDRNALIVVAIAAKNKEEIEASLDCGLVKGHAYAVTDVRYIDIIDPDVEAKIDAEVVNHSRISLKGASSEVQWVDEEIRKEVNLRKRIEKRQMMIRLQNPWGEKEWNGPWSDGSKEWEKVTDAQKKILGITVDEDGEFWMPWNSFVMYFTDISICQMYNISKATILPTVKPNTSRYSIATFIAKNIRYNEWTFLDRWTTNGVKSGAPRDRSGGCQNFGATFCFNPQYSFAIETTLPTEIMIALTQHHQQRLRKHREPFITIGLHLMRVELNRCVRIHQAINPIATSEYVSTRSIHLHLKELKPGRYIILPTTYAPREENSFMLRIYSTRNIKPFRLDLDTPLKGSLICRRSTRIVTRLRLIDVRLNNLRHGKSIYCIVMNGNERVRTMPVNTEHDDRTHRFEEQFVFFSNSWDQKFKLMVWENRHNRRKRNKLIGHTTLQFKSDNDCICFLFDIISPKQDKESPKIPIGKISIECCSYDDLFYL